ncbi:UNVERIFIED_CONTAM: hypothetical protein RMT77_011199 [Armadillidium vulgare]
MKFLKEFFIILISIIVLNSDETSGTPSASSGSNSHLYRHPAKYASCPKPNFLIPCPLPAINSLIIYPDFSSCRYIPCSLGSFCCFDGCRDSCYTPPLTYHPIYPRPSGCTKCRGKK